MQAVIDRGDDGWHALLVVLEPELTRLARSQPIGRLRLRDDSPSEIATRVIAKLRARDHAAIRKLLAADPPPNLEAWLRVVVKRSAIDLMRGHPEFDRRGGGGRWVTLVSLTSEAGGRAPDSLEQKRREVLEFVSASVERARAAHAAHGEAAFAQLALEWQIGRIHLRRLVLHGPRFLDVLQALLAGYSQAETATRLALSRREVELTMRYLEELLAARRFGA